MEVHPDFNELLRLFADFEVEYVIVEGYALAFHGAPRYPGDLDLLVHATAKNGERIIDALEEFGFGEANLVADDFAEHGRFVRLGHPPVRIDLLTSISGVALEAVYANRVQERYGNLDVPFIGRSEFVINKRASGRAKDLADIEALGERLVPSPPNKVMGPAASISRAGFPVSHLAVAKG